jgi:hypothetical protein
LPSEVQFESVTRPVITGLSPKPYPEIIIGDEAVPDFVISIDP